jgi:short-subunit dehydrogenase
MKETEIKGKWALVTGSSRGVGKRVAGGLAAKGANIILHARSIEATQGLAEELKSKYGVQVQQLAAELSNANEVAELIEKVKSICTAPDIIYNNAAIMTQFIESRLVPMEDYSTSFMVNCTAPAAICTAFLPELLKRGWGRIVNVTSGIEDLPELMAYSASKAALDRFVRDWSIHLKDTGVLMNLMDPGWLQTDLGGDQAPNHPDTVLPGALVPVLMDDSQGSGKLYRAQDYNPDAK